MVRKQQINKLRFLLLTVLTLILSQQTFTQLPVKGKIVDPVKCSLHPDQSYSLYLPQNYSETKKWPVILIFDPSARGKKGVEVFRTAGENYGYIVACSNNSRNGPLGNNFTAAAAMLEDIEKHFSTDRSRIYVSGFSGGSRFAMALAATNKSIAGVIGCGAGLPNDRSLYPASTSYFDYYGIAGNRDMNYTEFFDLKLFFAKYTSVTMNFATFDGGHDWPDSFLIEDATEWLSVRAMIKNLIPGDNNILTEYQGKVRARVQRATLQGDFINSALYMEFAARDFSGTPFGNEMSSSLSTLRQSKEFRDASREWNRIIMSEQERKQKYVEMLGPTANSGTIPDSVSGWWIDETESLRRVRDHGKPSDSQMSSRLLNFISILCYEQGNSEYRQKKYRMASVWFEVCTISDNTNPNTWYNYSRSLAGLSRNKESLAALEKAALLGFNNRKSLESDPVYNGIRNDSRFMSVIGKMDQ